jgi:hypothetical protein
MGLLVLVPDRRPAHDRHVRLRLHAADRAHQHLDLAREGLPLPHLAAEVEAARRRGDDQDAPGHQEVQRQDRGTRLADARLVGQQQASVREKLAADDLVREGDRLHQMPAFSITSPR